MPATAAPRKAASHIGVLNHSPMKTVPTEQSARVDPRLIKPEPVSQSQSMPTSAVKTGKSQNESEITEEFSRLGASEIKRLDLS